LRFCRLAADALGSGGRFNTCFHRQRGNSVNFLIDCGASSLPALIIETPSASGAEAIDLNS